jgi:WD40 repeat protein
LTRSATVHSPPSKQPAPTHPDAAYASAARVRAPQLKLTPPPPSLCTQFLAAFGGVLGKNLTHEQLTHLFMKIDANSDGSVDWDEFTNFMLLENQAASDMSDRSYSERLSEDSPPDPNPKHLHHRDMMDGILQVPKVEKLFTHSRDGTVRVWNSQNMSHIKTLRVSDSWVTNTCARTHSSKPCTRLTSPSLFAPRRSPTSPAVGSLHPGHARRAMPRSPRRLTLPPYRCHFAQSNRVAASSIDRSISFFDGGSCELVGQLTGLDTSPLCLGCWNDQLQEKLIVGDDSGNIALYDTTRNGANEASMSAASFRRGEDKGRHSDWVTKVEYYPDLNFMISSSLDGTLKIGEIESMVTKRPNRIKSESNAGERRGATTRVLGESNSAHSAVKRGVYTFTWSNTCKQLASSGLERTISLWNPYTRNPKPLAVLQGHTSSVQHVAINDDGFQLFSCSVDKCIKVWDLRSHKCLQTIHDKTPYRPEDRITAMAFDPGRSRLLTGSTRVRVWPLVKAAKRSTKPKHEHPLVAALYNKNFHQIVSGDESAQVCVWDVEKGEMVFHFTELHATKMSSMAFDEAGRRLITGANDGTVRVWNFSNGQCLQQLKNEGQLEVSCITFIVESQNKFIVAGGWNRKVLVWRDEASSSSSAAVETDRVMVGHEEDILSIAYSPPNLLATSGYDGKLLVWNMDSAILKFSLTSPGVEALDVDQRAMWKLVFLEKRSQALVSASADGKMRFWNVKEGCLVWEHDARHRNHDMVAMTTEMTNSFLFTGDGAGYIKAWDICRLLNVPRLDQTSHVIELAHWRAHDGCIASLDFVEKHRLILSSSTDTRIKMWRLDASGVFLAGVLGESAGPTWSLSEHEKFEPVVQEEEAGPDQARRSSSTGGGGGVKAVQPAASAADGAAGDDDDDDDDDDAVGGSSRQPGGRSFGSRPVARDGAGSGTQDHIRQILSGRSKGRSVLHTQTFRSLRTHDLADVSLTPRGTGNTPRGGGLSR